MIAVDAFEDRGRPSEDKPQLDDILEAVEAEEAGKKRRDEARKLQQTTQAGRVPQFAMGLPGLPGLPGMLGRPGMMGIGGKGSDCLNRLFVKGIVTPQQISVDLRQDLDTVAPHLAEIVVAKFEEELVRMRPIGGVRSPSGLLAALLVPVVPSRQVG